MGSNQAMQDSELISGLVSTGDAGARAPRLGVGLAHNAGDIEEAQRLRYKVFSQEMGAALGDVATAVDADEFDAFCDHLLVRDLESGRVAGTYRILPPHRAREIGRLYSESEFDLARFAHLRPSLIEVGRSCVHAEYRTGATIMMLWAGLAQYMRKGGYRHLIGCASASIADGGGQAASLRDQLQSYLSDPEYRVFPRLPFPHERMARLAKVEVPPLIKGYLRLGARVCGEPAWDPDFHCADFLVWLSLDAMRPRYARHFDLLASQGAQAVGS